MPSPGRIRAVAIAVGLTVSAIISVPGPPAGADGNEAPAAPAVARGLSAGGNHTCAIVTGNGLRCWGLNASGQLGLSGFTAVGLSPAVMGFDLPAVFLGTGRTAAAVSVGEQHTCALLDNSTVKCWGNGQNGRLGTGGTANLGAGASDMSGLQPVNLGTGRTASAITAGTSHTCALLDNGTVKCWGANGSGQLGLGDTSARGDAAGEMGDNLPAVGLGTGRTATAITAGAAYTCALLDNATVKCWGNNSVGQLGQGTTETRGDGAGEMGDNLPAVDLGAGRSALAISAGDSTACALLDNGALKCWGRNVEGQLGLGDTNARGDAAGEMGNSLPAIDLGAGRSATTVTVGSTHVCALLDTGRVKCWGAGASGRLGQGSTTTVGDGAGEMGDQLAPVALGTGRTATTVTAGSAHTCATLDNGTRKCWGSNTWGQLGQGDGNNRGDNSGEMGDNLFEIRLPPVGLIEGMLTDSATNVDIVGADVVALRTSDFGVAGTGTSTGGSLSYKVEVPPGTYFLYLLDPSGDHVSAFAGAPTMLTVTGGAATFSDVVMAPTRGGFTGHVIDQASQAPIAGAWVFAIGSGGIVGKATTDAAGAYTITGLAPGSYHAVALDAPGGRRAPRYHPASPDYAQSSAFNVVTGTTTSGIDFTLSG